MGVLFTGSRRGITPSLSNDNWTLDGPAGKVARVVEVTATGELTTSTAMQTRWARASGQAGAGTGGSVATAHPNFATNGFAFNTTYATTQPTLAAGDLWVTSWNAHGGVVRWLGAPEEWWFFIGAATAGVATTCSCRNAAGTGTSTYFVAWLED
jgi:hypothetical protein